jgi:acetoacetyl-CoA reductase
MGMAVPEEIRETKIIPQIPVGRLGEPDEVAALVLGSVALAR